MDDGEGGSLRIHYLDEGPSDAAPVLLMHGEPSWCYLYRKMVPIIAAAGHRVIAPDLVGFGRSDKPTRQSDYTYARHVEWMRQALFDVLDLRNITFFGQDWGGLVGLRLLAAEPDRYSRPCWGTPDCRPDTARPPRPSLHREKFASETKDFPVGAIVSGGTADKLSPEVIAAYDAPFPDDTYKAGEADLPHWSQAHLMISHPGQRSGLGRSRRPSPLRCCWPIPIPIRSRRVVTPRSGRRSPERRANRTPPSKAEDISCRRIEVPNSPP